MALYFILHKIYFTSSARKKIMQLALKKAMLKQENTKVQPPFRLIDRLAVWEVKAAVICLVPDSTS